MATHIYKCPNCDAELTFDPKRGDFACHYCMSRFNREELDSLATNVQAEEKQAREEADTGVAADGSLKLYSCPSCGAEIVADATTAATFCFYCHSPVILTGKLAGAFTPDRVIPFKVDKSEVREKLLNWCSKKKFIDKRFFEESQMEKLSGVYFPFWVLSTKLKSRFRAKGTKLRVWLVGDIEYTETSVFNVDRDASLSFDDFTLKALSREDTKLLNGVYPYDMHGAQPFEMAYLSGFYAEKRDLERAQVEGEAHAQLYAAAKELQEEAANDCGTLTETDCSVEAENEDWRYTLLPAWMLTYQYGGETYYFAMNGQTGKIAGRVPMDTSKITLTGALVGGGVFLLIMLLRLLLC